MSPRALICGALVLLAAAEAHAQFRRPVACTDCIYDFYYYDHGSFFVQDYDCQSSTYDGHLGTDFSLKGDNGAIANGYDIVAAAAGTVISTEDGYFDHCTECGGAQCGYDFGNGFANQVYIDHGSYRAMYGHMRTGSVAVQPGDVVTCGQKIGQIGSSGCSTGAHTHFEPQDASRRAVDPFVGDCSPTTSTLWVEQPAHRSLMGDACAAGDPPAPVCPAGTYEVWTCNDDKTERRRCIAGVDSTEPCPYGCLAMALGIDDECELPPDDDDDGSRADVDCDDASPVLHPGAVDSCGDGIDQDCSGADAECMTPPIAGTGAGMGGGAGAGAGMGVGGASGASGASGLAGATGGQAGAIGTNAGAGALGGFGAGAIAMPVSRAEPASCSASRVAEPGRSGRIAWLMLAVLAMATIRGRKNRSRLRRFAIPIRER